MTQEQIAERVGISQQYVDRLIAYVHEIDGLGLHAQGVRPSERVVRAVRTSGVPEEYKKPIVEKALEYVAEFKVHPANCRSVSRPPANGPPPRPNHPGPR